MQVRPNGSGTFDCGSEDGGEPAQPIRSEAAIDE